MKLLPRQALSNILRQYGQGIVTEPRRLKGLLNDFCGEYQTEITIIVYSAEENVAVDLISHKNSSSLELVLPRFTKRLVDRKAITAEAAQWAIDTWLLALGMSSQVNSPEVLPKNLTKPSQWIPSPEQEFEVWLRTNFSQPISSPANLHRVDCKAGFVTDYLMNLLPRIKSRSTINVDTLAELLCSFSITQPDMDYCDSEDRFIYERVADLYSNLLSRGFPTLCSNLVEDVLVESVSPLFLINKSDSVDSIHYQLPKLSSLPEEWVRSILRAPLVVNARHQTPINIPEFSIPEKKYLYSHLLPLVLSPPYDQLVSYPSDNDFMDCAFEWEGIKTGIKVIDTREGPNTNNTDQNPHGWQLLHITKQEIRDGRARSALLAFQEELENNPYFIGAQDSLKNPLWFSEIGRKAQEFVLTPYAVARVQKALLMAIKESMLDFRKPIWKFVVIERDVPCAVLAVADFYDHIKAYFQLLGINRPIPEISIQVFNSSELRDGNEEHIGGLEERNISFNRRLLAPDVKAEHFKQADLIIDVSILYRDNGDVNFFDNSNGHFSVPIFIISSNTKNAGNRQIYSFNPIAYPITEQTDDSLRFFLQNIFRKIDFRPGQIEIIKRAINLKPVVGLLPTGAGKSISYQLPALLQSGVSLVVDPLRSLMLDQYTNLKEQYLIDSVGIVSSQFSAEERENVLKKLKNGELQFLFIAPERLQNKEFRKTLVELVTAFPIVYAVIDEAHCVSEWGHDFRTSYLNMSKTIRENCAHKGVPPSIIALTGTASYSVLIDIQREIDVFDDDALILPPSFDREELEFGVYSVSTDQKWQKLAGLLRSLPGKFRIPNDRFFTPNQEQTAAGLIFVPHANGPYGVTNIADKINKELKIEAKIYSGSKPKDWNSNLDFEDEKENTQREFKNNEFPLLVATKAFGMGIDKPNIRYTIHYNIPPSLEAFYQEVGRAGRDQKKAFCALIFSDDRVSGINLALDPSSPVETIHDIQNTNRSEQGDISRLFWFHGQSFKGTEIEYQKIVQVYRPIYKLLGQVSIGDYIQSTVPFANSIDTRDEIEKALYRLSVVGGIDDYTIDFRARCFDIVAHRSDEEEYIAKIKNYVARYKTPQEVLEVPEKVKSQAVQGIIFKSIKFLLGFVYQEVEKKRRAAIRTMVEVTRQASVHSDPNTYIRQELIAYMKQTPVNDLLLKLVRRMNSKEWWEILDLRDDENNFLLDSEEGARKILGGCRRTLESFPDHPGILFIAGIVRLFLPDQAIEETYNDLLAGLHILERRKESGREMIAFELLDVLENRCVNVHNIDEVKIRVAHEMINLFPDRRTYRRVISISKDEALAALLIHAARKLHLLNENLKGEL